MLSINLDDVMQVLTNVRGYLIAFGVVALLAIVAMIAVRKLPKAKKKMIRAQSGLAILLALTIVVNLICTGPMSTMLDLVSGSGTITEETSAKATELVNEITADGVVLAKDEDGILPVASGSKLNVFGWASTNPCYGGTGSGALNTAYPVTDLLTGLHDAGIETNEELSKFYTDYKADRPSVGMAAQEAHPGVELVPQQVQIGGKQRVARVDPVKPLADGVSMAAQLLDFALAAEDPGAAYQQWQRRNGHQLDNDHRHNAALRRNGASIGRMADPGAAVRAIGSGAFPGSIHRVRSIGHAVIFSPRHAG